MDLVLVRFPEASVEVLEADLDWEFGLLENEKLFEYFQVLKSRKTQTALKRITQEFICKTCPVHSEGLDLIRDYLMECVSICADKLYMAGHYQGYQSNLILLGVKDHQLVFVKGTL